MKKCIKIIIGIFLLLSVFGQKNFGFYGLVFSDDYNFGLSVGKNVSTIMFYTTGFWLLLTAIKNNKISNVSSEFKKNKSGKESIH